MTELLKSRLFRYGTHDGIKNEREREREGEQLEIAKFATKLERHAIDIRLRNARRPREEEPQGNGTVRKNRSSLARFTTTRILGVSSIQSMMRVSISYVLHDASASSHCHRRRRHRRHRRRRRRLRRYLTLRKMVQARNLKDYTVIGYVCSLIRIFATRLFTSITGPFASRVLRTTLDLPLTLRDHARHSCQ